MADFITIRINGIDCTIEVIPRAYSHVLKLIGESIELYFEPDESGNYRLFKMPWQDDVALKKIDVAFIQETLTILNSLNN